MIEVFPNIIRCDGFINDFLNEKVVVHDKMTAGLRSALNSLGRKIPKVERGTLISESNTSESDDE